MAEPPGDVAEVAERSGLMALENVGVQVRNFAAAHGVQEVSEVAFAFARKSADQLPIQIEERSVGDDSFSAFEYPTAFEVRIERLGFQSSRFRDDGLASEIKHTNLCVRCLRCIRVPKTSSETDDSAAKSRYPEAPAANIERVNVVVAQLAVSRVPEPMPVVMKLGTRERIHRGWASPKVVIDA